MEYQIKPNQKIPSDILDDLASRFIINIPVEERSDMIRLCFQIELAYWFYIDFICQSKPNLTGCSNKVFALQLFQVIQSWFFLKIILVNILFEVMSSTIRSMIFVICASKN